MELAWVNPNKCAPATRQPTPFPHKPPVPDAWTGNARAESRQLLVRSTMPFSLLFLG
jgi:hypothetical protein